MPGLQEKITRCGKRKIGTARVNKKKNKFIVSEEMIKEMMNGGSEEYFNGF